MADDPISLSAYRASRSSDAADWTVVDCLKETLREIEAGEISPDAIAIVLSGGKDNEDGHLWYRQAGTSRPKRISMFAAAHYHVVKEYVGD